MSRKASATCAGIVLAAVVAASAAPATAEVPPPPPVTPSGASGTVTGTVNVPAAAAPCILLEGTATDFGTRPFQTNATAGLDGYPGTPRTPITNCSGTTETLFARVSNATGGAAIWTPFNTPGGNGSCPARGMDRFIYRVGLSSPTDIPLGSADAAVPGFNAIPDGGRRTMIHSLFMPCVGSSGAGQPMSMTTTFTASF